MKKKPAYKTPTPSKLPLPITQFPEATNPDFGLKVFGPLSLETQLAVLTRFLHNGKFTF